MVDLADWISRGAVAALDLAPRDDRFAKLSRLVLTGGASRFGPAVNPDEPVQYVIPVALPHTKIEYGALLVQTTQLGIVWREANVRDRAHVVPLDQGLAPRYAPLTLAGEEWTRFDLVPDDPEAAFLLPPLSSPLLKITLISLLGARALGDPGPAFPAPATPASPPTPIPTPAPASPRTPDRAVPQEPASPDPEATQPMAALTPPPPPPPPQTSPDPEATQPMQALPGDDDPTRVRPAPRVAPAERREDAIPLFRDETRPRQPVAPTAPQPALTAPRSPVAPAAPPVPAATVQVYDEGGASLTVRGFLIGLGVTLGLGFLFILVMLLT
ncbi:MAG: hypothetical protein ACK5LS_07565 [Propioniciclava sp.]